MLVVIVKLYLILATLLKRLSTVDMKRAKKLKGDTGFLFSS